MPPSVLWFRRDIRLGDHPALHAAARAGDGRVLALFVVDPALTAPSGPNRIAFLRGCLDALDQSIGGRLVIREGRPADVVSAVAAESGADEVHVTADFGPYGRRRDDAVEHALAADGRTLVRTGSPYAVPPGTCRTGGGTPYRVYTPFSKSWAGHGWDAPLGDAPAVQWLDARSHETHAVRDALNVLDDLDVLGTPPNPPAPALPRPGEAAAHERWQHFLETGIDDYGTARNRPDLDGTSRLSPYLKWGCVHPRQLLADLAPLHGKGPETFRRELAWRDFYADVVFHRPTSTREVLQPNMAAYPFDTGPDADDRFDAWAAGRTGYPYIDAGMRQLLGEGWVHNRVRMAVASFLVKDLHLDWRRGAAHFMHHLVDGDLASNYHGWQWTAGTGTDPAPFFRVFNPIDQGKKFDPDGDYVRRWVPELRGIRGARVHEPWKDAATLLPVDYPARIIDHAEERAEALARWNVTMGR